MTGPRLAAAFDSMGKRWAVRMILSGPTGPPTVRAGQTPEAVPVKSRGVVCDGFRVILLVKR